MLKVSTKSAAALLAAAGLFVTGCSTNESASKGGAQAKTSWSLPSKPYPNVRDQVHGLFKGNATRMAATEELIWRCMREKGFDYAKLPPLERDANPTMTDPQYGLSVKEAKKSGYPDKPVREEGGREDPHKQLSSSEKQEWGEAFYGPQGAEQVSVTLPDGSEIQTSSKGCLAKGRRQIWGNVENRIKSTNFGANLPIEALRRAGADPRMQKLNSKWASCMAENGHSGLDKPEAAISRAREPKTPDPQAIAVADAKCEEKLGYAEKRRNLEDLYLTAALMHYEAEVAALREINAKALERAESVLSS